MSSAASDNNHAQDDHHNIELMEEGRGLLQNDANANSASVFTSGKTDDYNNHNQNLLYQQQQQHSFAVSNSGNSSNNINETVVQLPPASAEVQQELERQAERLIDEHTEDELVLIYKEIEKWRLQVRIWSAALLVRFYYFHKERSNNKILQRLRNKY